MTNSTSVETQLVLLARYPPSAASSRLRLYDLEEIFQEFGPVRFFPFFTDEHVRRIGRTGPQARLLRLLSSLLAYARRVRTLLLLRASKKPTMLVIQIEVLPSVPAWIELALIRIAGPQRTIIDLDDAFYESYRAIRNPIGRRLLTKKMERIWRRADVVIGGSPVLVDEVKRHVGPKTEVVLIPTVVDPDRYPLHQHDVAADPIVVGWIGSPTTTKQLAHIMPALEAVARSRPLELVLVGAVDLPRSEVSTRSLPWSLESETALAQSFDIGIMPLEDTPFTRGKCGYKLIQYMAAGVPVIASDVGVNRRIVLEGPEPCGHVANTVQDWIEALTDLADDSDKRSQMGSAGRTRVEATYSIDAIRAPWLRILAPNTTLAR